MGVLSRIWFGMRTRNKVHAGTEDSIRLIINEGGVEKLNVTFADTSQDDQDRGKSNLYELEGHDIRPENLTNSSIQVSIHGDEEDFWHPEHVLIWGEEANNRVVPVAAEWNIEAGISPDPSEGDSGFLVRRIGYPIKPITQLPDKKAWIRQLLIVLTTADVEYAGTTQNPVLEITYAGRDHNPIEIKTPRMTELNRGQGCFSLPWTDVPQITPPLPRWNNLESVVLKIDGPDKWLPSSFSVFGLTTPYRDLHLDNDEYEEPEPNSIMPLIHIPKWDLGPLSTDHNLGVPSVTLPLLLLPSLQLGPLDPTGSKTL